MYSMACDNRVGNRQPARAIKGYVYTS